MGQQAICGPEERLFDALGEVFELEHEDALDVSRRAVCLIASFVADVGALSGSSSAVTAALSRINEMQSELAQLSEHLLEYRNEVGLRLVR